MDDYTNSITITNCINFCIFSTDMLPAISLAYENKEANIMKKPRDANVDRLVTSKPSPFFKAISKNLFTS